MGTEPSDIGFVSGCIRHSATPGNHSIVLGDRADLPAPRCVAGAVQKQQRRSRLRAAVAVSGGYRRLVQNLQVQSIRQLVLEAVHGRLRCHSSTKMTCLCVLLHVSNGCYTAPQYATHRMPACAGAWAQRALPAGLTLPIALPHEAGAP